MICELSTYKKPMKIEQGQEQPQLTRKKIYQKINYEKRMELINFVEKKGMKICQAAKLLTIKSSTAKAIIRSFRRYGKVFQKKVDKLKRQIIIENEKNHKNSQERHQFYPIYFHPIQNFTLWNHSLF